jgi:hypothetical protein
MNKLVYVIVMMCGALAFAQRPSEQDTIALLKDIAAEPSCQH